MKLKMLLAAYFAASQAFAAGTGSTRVQTIDQIKRGSGTFNVNSTGTITAPNATDTLMGKATTDTMTNKTYDAEGTGNTLSNVKDANIKAGAAIARSKLGTGSNNHVVINDGSGNFSSEATLAKSRGGTGADNSSVTFPTSGTLARTSGDTFTSTTLTNPTITNGRFDTPTLDGQASAPTNPSAGDYKIYVKDTTKKLTILDSTGQETSVGAGAADTNLLTNGDFENATVTDGWTVSNGTASPDTSDYNPDGGKQSISFSLTTVNGKIFEQCKTPAADQNFSYSLYAKTSLTTVQVCSSVNSIEQQCASVPSINNWIEVSPSAFAKGGQTTCVYAKTTSSTTGTVKFDTAYMGLNKRIGSGATPTFFGGMEQAGATSCTYVESTSSGITNYVDLGTGTGCNSWVIDGDGAGTVTAVGTNDHRITLSNLAAGRYEIKAIGLFNVLAAGTCNFRLSDGTTTYQNNGLSNSGGTGGLATLNFSVAYASPQASVTFKLQGSDDQASGCRWNNSGGSNTTASWKVYYTPPTSIAFVRPNLPIFPTVTRLTSGTSQTYTTPAGVTRLRVRMVGGGGGGGGGGQSNTGGTGGTGGTTSFGTLSAAGGTGGAGQIGAAGSGGAPTFTGFTCCGYNGGGGQAGGGLNVANGSSFAMSAGKGGASIFGGEGKASPSGAGAGSKGEDNTGGGGGGGGVTFANSVVCHTGAGGGAGAGIDVYINNPSATYTYSVGAGGTSGTAGTNGGAGGVGGTGLIEITEEYQGSYAPLLINGVVSAFPGTTFINTVQSKSANFTADIMADTYAVDSSGGNVTVTLPAASTVTGKRYTFTQKSNTNRVIIDPNASETVCGQATISLWGANDAVEIYSDGTAWQGVNASSCSVTKQARIADNRTINAQTGNWISSIGGTTGFYGITINTGVFSSGAIACNCNANYVGVGPFYCSYSESGVSATNITFGVYNSAAASTDRAIIVNCSGPR